VLSVNLIHWVVELLQVLDLLLDVLEDMLVFDSIDRTDKIPQGGHLLLYFVEVVLVVYNNGIVQLFDGFKAFLYLCKLVFTINLHDRIVESPQICQVSVNLCKVVTSLYSVHRTLERFQVGNDGV